MFCYDGERLYFITKESAKEGLEKFLKVKFEKVYSERIAKTLMRDIIDNTTIPNEYNNENVLYILSSCGFPNETKRYIITNSGIKIDKKCEFPLPHCSKQSMNESQIENSYYAERSEFLLALSSNNLPLVDEFGIRSDLKVNNFMFRTVQHYIYEISSYVDILFNHEVSKELSEKIINAVSMQEEGIFIYYVIEDSKPALYKISLSGVSRIAENGMWSASCIADILQRNINVNGLSQNVQNISNQVHNYLFFNFAWQEEELANPISVSRDAFVFKKTVDDIDFYLTKGYTWMSDLLEVQLKDLTWDNKVDGNVYFPRYKDFQLLEPQDLTYVFYRKDRSIRDGSKIISRLDHFKFNAKRKTYDDMAQTTMVRIAVALNN